MTIEEAIKQIYDKALRCEEESKMWYEALEFIEQKDVTEIYKKNGDYWKEQATDRYQLVLWLKELHDHREAWENVLGDISLYIENATEHETPYDKGRRDGAIDIYDRIIKIRPEVDE